MIDAVIVGLCCLCCITNAVYYCANNNVGVFVVPAESVGNDADDKTQSDDRLAG